MPWISEQQLGLPKFSLPIPAPAPSVLDGLWILNYLGANTLWPCPDAQVRSDFFLAGLMVMRDAANNLSLVADTLSQISKTF